jgi:hypothetical protein
VLAQFVYDQWVKANRPPNFVEAQWPPKDVEAQWRKAAKNLVDKVGAHMEVIAKIAKGGPSSLSAAVEEVDKDDN